MLVQQHRWMQNVWPRLNTILGNACWPMLYCKMLGLTLKFSSNIVQNRLTFIDDRLESFERPSCRKTANRNSSPKRSLEHYLSRTFS